MSKEYIEREALLAEYDRVHVGAAGGARKLIESFPAADVVQVVRCRDCKRSGMYAFGFGDKEELACLEIEEDGFIRFTTAVDPNGYCSNGERKDDAAN